MRHHSRQRGITTRAKRYHCPHCPKASHAVICTSTHLSVQEVSSHEKLQGNFRLDGELGDLGRAVGVAQLVVEILDNLLKDGRRDLAEVDGRWNFYEKVLTAKYKELKQLYFQRQLDGWQLSKEESGVTLYTKIDQETGLKTIRGEGVINAPAKKILETALNISEHTLWDDTMEQGKLIETKNNYHVVYNILKRIGFTTKREILTVVSSFPEKDGTIYGVATSIENIKQQENPMYVRANVNMAGWVLKPLEYDPNSTHVTYILSCDPKGMIPKSLINWFAEQQGMNVRKLGNFVEKKVWNESQDIPEKPFFFK